MLIPFKDLLAKYGIMPTGVFHIGSSWGQEAKDYFDNNVDRVIFIEAIPDVFKQLERHIAQYPRMVAINECIGNQDGIAMTFHVANNEGQSSSLLELGTHKQAHPEVHYTHNIQVVTKRVDTLLKERQINLSEYDFLNIDLQGAELMALQGMGEELKKVKYAFLEVNKQHLYVGCPLLADIDKYMNHYGFERVECEWAGNTGWGDAFYVRVG